MIQDGELSVERSDLSTVHQHCPDRPYLELTVPDNAIAVTFIKYNVCSRDQGIEFRLALSMHNLHLCFDYMLILADLPRQAGPTKTG